MRDEEKLKVVDKFFDELRQPIRGIIHMVPDNWDEERVREFILALLYIAILGKEKQIKKMED